MISRLDQLERRVLMMELALRNHGVTIDEYPRPQAEETYEPKFAPAQLRALGQPYCPKCYTFGNEHRNTCPYSDQGMTNHVRITK